MSTLLPLMMHATFPVQPGEASCEHRGHAHRRTALGDEAFVSEQVRHARRDLPLAHEHVVVHDPPHQLEGVAVVHPDAAAEAVGEARLFGHRYRASGPNALDHGRTPLHRHSDDPEPGIGRLEGDCGAPEQATSREARDERIDAAEVFEELEPDGALTGDDVRVVEGMHGHEPLVSREAFRLELRFVLGLAVDPQLRAEALDSGPLVRGHQLREADDGPRLDAPGGEGHRPAMVAGGDGDHTLCAFVRVERAQAVGGATDLEGAGFVRGLELEMHLRTGEPREGLRAHERSTAYPVRDRPSRAEDVAEIDGLRHRRSKRGSGRATRPLRATFRLPTPTPAPRRVRAGETAGTRPLRTAGKPRGELK